MGRRVDKAWYFCLRAFFRQHFPNSFLKDKTDHKSLELQSSTQFSVYSLGPLIIKFIVVEHSEIWKILNRFHGSHCTSGVWSPFDQQVPAGREEVLHFQGLSRVVQLLCEVWRLGWVRRVSLLQIQDVRVDVGDALGWRLENTVHRKVNRTPGCIPAFRPIQPSSLGRPSDVQFTLR